MTSQANRNAAIVVPAVAPYAWASFWNGQRGTSRSFTVAARKPIIGSAAAQASQIDSTGDLRPTHSESSHEVHATRAIALAACATRSMSLRVGWFAGVVARARSAKRSVTQSTTHAIGHTTQ